MEWARARMLVLGGRRFERAGSQAPADSLRTMSGRLLVAVFAVSATLIFGALFAEWQQRKIEVRDAETAAENLARSLAQHADDTFEMVDTALIGLLDRIDGRVLSNTDLEAVRNALRRHAVGMPRVRSFSIFDEVGKTVATSLPSAPADGSNADREYFRHHAKDVSMAPYVGDPIQSRTDGTWIVTLSRRYSRPDGKFGGVVLATMDVTYFSRFYSTLSLGESGSVALTSRAGIILARAPHEASFVGRDVSGTGLFTEKLPKAAGGAYQIVSPLDGIVKIAGYRAGVRFPLVALVAFGEREALSNWRESARLRMTAVVLLTSLIWLLGLFLIGRLKRLRSVQVAITASEANFRALAENAGDVVARLGPDWVVRYISPASTAVLKRAPEDIVGLNALEGLDPTHRKTLEDAAAALRAGDTDSVTLTYETRRADDAWIWLETTFRSARDPRTGKFDGVVTVSRDMTSRVLYERQLAAMASTDSLTGLANRRHFDEALKREEDRAKRDGTQLALILFDLDRFKQFNDTYGHAAGDAALFQVAASIADAALRPGDLAARYGGEEIVLLLPGTSLRGAELVAERARAAVHGLGIPHAGNLPFGAVTISCGVATAEQTARSGSQCSKPLLECADEALYVAKHLGRNAVSRYEPHQSSIAA